MKLDEVQTKEDFLELLEIYKTSNAPIEVREQAINKLKSSFPHWDDTHHLPTMEVLQMIKDGESDISDMGGY